MKIIEVDAQSGQVSLVEVPDAEPTPLPTELELEERYKIRAKELIHEQYDNDRELGMTHKMNVAIATNQTIPTDYLQMLECIDRCKDQAHREVYGRER